MRIRFLEERTRDDPLDFIAPTRLGNLYLARARSRGDPGAAAQAGAALRTALERRPDHAPALRALAAACLAEHRFPEALEAARRAVKLDPAEAEGHAVLGDAFLESGDAPRAAECYTRFAGLLPGLYSDSRLARLRLREGDPAGAMALLETAVKGGDAAGAPAEDIAWCHVQIGEIAFRRGDWEKAEEGYERALRLAPESSTALDHLAELRAAQRHYEAAIHLYERLVALAPRPDLHQALGDVAAAMGKEELAREHRRRALAGYLQAARGGMPGYYHHLAAYYSDVEIDGAEAVRWAREDLKLRQTAPAFDALAWALYRAGEIEAATAAIRQALRSASRDAHVLDHAAQIFYRAGEEQAAREYLRQALHANPRFKEFHVHR